MNRKRFIATLAGLPLLGWMFRDVWVSTYTAGPGGIYVEVKHRDGTICPCYLQEGATMEIGQEHSLESIDHKDGRYLRLELA